MYIEGTKEIDRGDRSIPLGGRMKSIGGTNEIHEGGPMKRIGGTNETHRRDQ